MAGRRATDDTPIPFAPGVISNLADRDATNRYKDSNRVRWHKGLAEKLGGWARQTFTGANNGVYVGVARALHDWSSLDTQKWIAIGTHCKLYLVNNGKLNDVTPLRKASNTTGTLSVQAGSPVITINDPDHRARTGDHIRLFATSPIGGFDVNGVYDIESVVTPDAITVRFSSNFNATETGGGSVTIEYDITCGLPINGELRGYGTGVFGAGTFGTIRPVGAGVPRRMRIWSLDNWGEDLLGAPSDGELYWWDRTSGPNSRAALVAEAPGAIQRMLVNGKEGFVILLGCTNLDGTPDPMRFRWCSQSDFRIWTPTRSNTAGGGRFDKGSRIVTGISSGTTNYVWSDTFMYALQYVGPPFHFVPTDIGSMKIVGPNAATDVNGTAFAMGFDDFYIFDGTLRVLICELHTKIFGDENRNIEGLFDRTQAEAVYASSYLPKNEVTWFYPCTDGVTRYVTYNFVLDCWYGGVMERTAYHDVSEAITGYKTNPYAANGGYIYKHEVGTDEVEGAVTTPQAWYLETYDINAGGSDKVMLWNSVIPNFDRLSGSMRMLLKKKAKPQQRTYQTRGPYVIDENTVDISVRCKGSQIAMRFESAGELGEDWRMGVFQVNATPYGGRVGVHIEDPEPPEPVPPGEVTLSGEVQSNIEGESVTILAATEGDFFHGFSTQVVPPFGTVIEGEAYGYQLESAYYNNVGVFDISFHMGSEVAPQDLFDTVSIQHDGGVLTLNSADASYQSGGDEGGEWAWTGHGVPTFTNGQQYTLTFNAVGGSNIVLSWTASAPGDAAIAGYRVYNADNDSLVVDTGSAAVLTYEYTEAPVGTYRYYVVAYATDGQVGERSNVVTLVVEEQVEPTGPEPATITEVVIDDEDLYIRLIWSAPTFAEGETLDHYELYRVDAFTLLGEGTTFESVPSRDAVETFGAMIATIAADALLYTDEIGNTNGMEYAYFLRSVGSEGTELDSQGDDGETEVVSYFP